eukprot:scaffold4717_cov66-Cyclotella_meneghiniana.AAC.4
MARWPRPCSGRYLAISTSGTREIGVSGITSENDSPLRKVAPYPFTVPENSANSRVGSPPTKYPYPKAFYTGIRHGRICLSPPTSAVDYDVLKFSSLSNKFGGECCGLAAAVLLFLLHFLQQDLMDQKLPESYIKFGSRLGMENGDVLVPTSSLIV